MKYSTIFTQLSIIVAVQAPLLWASDLLISRHAAKVLPHRMTSIPAEMTGELEVCHFGGKNVKEGTLLARLNRCEYELAERELEQQINRNNLDRDSELLKLQREKEELTFISSLDPKQRPFVEQRMKGNVDARALELLERKINLVKNNTKLLNEKLRMDFNRRWKMSSIRMPYDGVVQYHITLPEKEGDSVIVTGSTAILTVADDSKLYVAVVLTDPELARLEVERFSVRVSLGRGRNGEEIHGTYAFRRIEKQGQNEQPVYYFEVPGKQRDDAWKLVGSNLIASLLYRCEDDWRYEAKRELSTEAGKNTFTTWEELIAALRPGYELVFCGETHICIRPVTAQPDDGKTP